MGCSVSYRLFMRCLLLIVVPAVHLMNQAALYGQEKEIIPVWENGLPEGSSVLDDSEIDELMKRQKAQPDHVTYVENPTLTVFPAPAESANGASVIICPGGGYNVLAWKKEGLEIAEFFNSIGVTAFVLKYRVPRRIPDKIHWEPMQDLQRAIRLVRHESKNKNSYQIDPDRIGVLGFSAGGHLTVMAGTQYETECYDPRDDIDKESARPDFICPIYAAYLGANYSDNKVELGSLVKVSKETPPTFLAVTADDAMRGAQSALLFVQLNEHGINAELHIYSKGGHGYGLRPTENPVSKWGAQLGDWLQASGFLDSTDK